MTGRIAQLAERTPDKVGKLESPAVYNSKLHKDLG